MTMTERPVNALTVYGGPMDGGWLVADLCGQGETVDIAKTHWTTAFWVDRYERSGDVYLYVGGFHRETGERLV
jgi:hypothetical protein